MSTVLNGILAGLVAVTSGAAFFQPLDSFLIGALGCIANTIVPPILDKFRIDDPVGAVAVHCGAGLVFNSFELNSHQISSLIDFVSFEGRSTLCGNIFS